MPTLRVAALASQAVKRSELARVAAPIVALLHTQTALTAHLVSPSYDCVLCLVHAAEDGTSTPRLGELVPAHCTAGGKTLLAGRDRWRESLLSSALRAYTDRTITDPGAVEQEAATTRERGYAIEDGEYRPGVRALAAPVHDGARATIAAIGVSTSGNLDVETQARIGRPVYAAIVLSVGAGALRGLIAGRPEHLVLAVTDENVYLLNYRRRTLGSRVSGVVAHLPRAGLIAQWQRRRLDVKVQLSWPDEHVFLTGRAKQGTQTDLAIGLLMVTELERYT